MSSQRDTRILVQVSPIDGPVWHTLPVLSRGSDLDLRFREAGISWDFMRVDVAYNLDDPAVKLVLEHAAQSAAFEFRIFPDGKEESLQIVGRAKAHHAEINMDASYTSIEINFTGKGARLLLGEKHPFQNETPPPEPKATTPKEPRFASAAPHSPAEDEPPPHQKRTPHRHA